MELSGPSVLLNDVLAFTDSVGALLIAFSVLGFCLLGMKSWVWGPESQMKKDPPVEVPQVLQVSQLQLPDAYPECVARGKDLDAMSAKMEVPHCLLCNVVFERGLEVTVEEVQGVAQLLSAAFDPVGEERRTQAAAASSDNLRARSGEEEKMNKEKWSLPTKK